VAVKIRLKRMGKIRVPHYRIVVADSRTKRDGRVIEEIGKYHPKEDPSLIEVDSERAQYWLAVGAQPSEPVLALLKLTGDWQRFKGDPTAESTVRVSDARREKSDIFNEALKDAHGEPKTEAVTRRRKPAASTAAAAETAAAETPAVDTPTPEAAAESPAPDSPAPESPAPESPAPESPAPDAPAAEETADALDSVKAVETAPEPVETDEAAATSAESDDSAPPAAE
jgi:small subunit ribosomal protein S16